MNLRYIHFEPRRKLRLPREVACDERGKLRNSPESSLKDGRALLDRQAPEGWWVRPDDEGWMATTDALVLMRVMGVDPSSDEARTAIARVKDRLT